MNHQTKAIATAFSLASAIGFGWLVLRPRNDNEDSDDGAPDDIAPEFACSVSMTPFRKQAHIAARPIMVQAFKDEMGRAGTIPEIQYAQSIAQLESSYGKGWEGDMKGCHNWGAVQCPQGSSVGPGCVMYTDSHSSGRRYDQTFRCYGSDLEGARDVINHVFKKRKETAAILADPKGTIFRTSYAMRREGYYGGFCPKSTARYGAAASDASFGHPDRDDGTRACAQEAITLHAQRVRGLICEIAQANGDASVFPLGTYADADKWYRARNPNPLRGA